LPLADTEIEIEISPINPPPTQENAGLASTNKIVVEIPVSNSFGPVTPKQPFLSLKANPKKKKKKKNKETQTTRCGCLPFWKTPMSVKLK